MTLYSVGHSTHTIDAFVHLCRTVEIDLVCDVRRFPVSRRHPQFTRQRFDAALRERGIDYLWLGEELGGLRDGGYDEWMTTPAFAAGVDTLERLATDQTVAVLCAEGLPAKCHRRFIAEALASRGSTVGHLLPDATVEWVQPPLRPAHR